MKTLSKTQTDLFFVAFTAVAFVASVILISMAAALPEGIERGAFLVDGYGAVMGMLLGSLALRAMYWAGFNRALRLSVSLGETAVTA